MEISNLRIRNGWRPLWGAALVLAAVLAAVSPAGAEDLLVDPTNSPYVLLFQDKAYGKVTIAVGDLNQIGGTTVIDTTLTLEIAAVYTLDGFLASNKLSVGQNEYVGKTGVGDFSQGTAAFSGTHSVGWDLNVGGLGAGTFTLGGSGSLSVGQDENIGSGLGAGAFFQGLLSTGSILGFSGNHSVTRDLILGSGLGAGAFTLCGSGDLEVGRDEIVGSTVGVGTFYQGIFSSGIILVQCNIYSFG